MDLASLLPILTTGASLASTGSGLYQSYENQKYQDQLRSLAGNPQKMQQYAAGFTQPLTAGLTEGVNNQAQAYAAERGLASSPALEQQIENQAIAPYIQQNQNQGFQNALQALGLGGGANPGNPSASTAAGLSGLMKLLSSGSGSNPGAFINAVNAGNSQPVSTYDPTFTDTLPPVDMTSFSFGG
jgi:hypothetical protein